MIDKSILPSNWEVKQLGEVAKYLNGRAFKPIEWKQSGKPIIRIQNLNKPDAAYNYTNQEFEDRYKVENGNLLFAWSASLGAYIWKGKDAWLNQHIFKVIPEEGTNKLYLFYLLEKITQELYAKAHGSGMVHVTKGKFEATEIPLPPLSEQQEIVAKIEELFSELDKGKEQLETARQQLKVYRQAVLEWAFEVDKEKYKSNTLAVVSDKIQIGPFGTQLHKEDYIEGGIPLINPMHIVGGLIKADSSYSITPEKRDSLPNYILLEGDVIMGRRGEMGRCGLVTAKEDGWFCGTGSLYIRPNKDLVDPEFLYFYLSNDTVKKYLEENAGGTTMANLNLKIVNNIPIHLPTLEEQQQIVQEIKSRLSVCDKVEETISHSLQQAETLRQSVLKQAFEGKLIKTGGTAEEEQVNQLKDTAAQAGQYQISFDE